MKSLQHNKEGAMKSFLSAGVGVLLLFGVAIGSAEATTIDFTGGSGGFLFFGGGNSNPLVGSNLLIGSVAVGASSASVTGGLLNFTTGDAIASITPGLPVGALWTTFFDEGVIPITVTGGVSAAGIPNGSSLMVGTFNLNQPRFSFFPAGNGILDAPGLAITSTHPGLLAYFGQTGSLLSGGTLALSLSNFTFGAGFPQAGSGFTAGGNSASLVATVATPEPASALLLGSGMIGVFTWGRKKLLKEMAPEAV
jgi:hypothetical protein